MTGIIMAHGGALDKYVGDALMALWGAPLPQADHAVRACRAALEMQAAMPALKADWQRRGLPPAAVRLGLHSGPAVAGNVGSRERFNYTVLGDTVNLASRLEGVNELYGTEILLSEATYRLAAEVCLVRELDRVQVKGRVQPVTIYELLGLRPNDGPLPWVPVFDDGRVAYLQQDWDRAITCFQEVLRLKPGDVPAQIYLNRCANYRRPPPPPDWAGVVILESK